MGSLPSCAHSLHTCALPRMFCWQGRAHALSCNHIGQHSRPTHLYLLKMFCWQGRAHALSCNHIGQHSRPTHLYLLKMVHAG